MERPVQNDGYYRYGLPFKKQKQNMIRKTERLPPSQNINNNS